MAGTHVREAIVTVVGPALGQASTYELQVGSQVVADAEAGAIGDGEVSFGSVTLPAGIDVLTVIAFDNSGTLLADLSQTETVVGDAQVVLTNAYTFASN